MPRRPMIAPVPNTSDSFASDFNAFDWLLLASISWSVVLAFTRGIIREIFSLTGTILGLLLASWNYSTFAIWLSRWITSPTAAQVAGFLLIALSVTVLCTLLGRLVRGTAHTVGFGFFDRLAGAGFGFIRGALIGTGIFVVAIAFFPPQPIIANSRIGPYFLAAAREVSFVVPQDLQKRITGGIDSITRISRR